MGNKRERRSVTFSDGNSTPESFYVLVFNINV